MEDPNDVVIDFTQTQIWDASTVAALDPIEIKYRNLGKLVRFKGFDERSAALYRLLTGHVSGN